MTTQPKNVRGLKVNFIGDEKYKKSVYQDAVNLYNKIVEVTSEKPINTSIFDKVNLYSTGSVKFIKTHDNLDYVHNNSKTLTGLVEEFDGDLNVQFTSTEVKIK